MPGCLADRISQHALPFVGRVQVDQCSARAAMAHAVHQFAQVCASISGQGVSRMPQVVKMDIGQSGLSYGGKPARR